MTDSLDLAADGFDLLRWQLETGGPIRLPERGLAALLNVSLCLVATLNGYSPGDTETKLGRLRALLSQSLQLGDPGFDAFEVLAVYVRADPSESDRLVVASLEAGDPTRLAVGMIRAATVILNALAVGHGCAPLQELTVLADSIDVDRGLAAGGPLPALGMLRSQLPKQRVTSVLCVPGPWRTRSELQAGVLPEFAFAGDVMMRIDGRDHVTLEFQRPLDRLGSAFRAAGRASTITDSEFDRIQRHASCCYVSSETSGSLAEAQRLSEFALALIDSGGLAVKVDSTGRAHASSTWRELVANPSPGMLVDGWVTWVGESDTSFTSCGMHNLGLPDVLVSGTDDPQEAFQTMRALCVYLVAEAPVMRSGQTFSLDPGRPRWRLDRGRSTFDRDSLFFNPYGTWALTPALIPGSA